MVALAEIAALAALAAAASGVIVRGTRGGLRAGLLATLVCVTGAAAAVRGGRADARPPPGAPGRGTVVGYVSSAACLGCHPGEHASFRRTYHRTMTQLASTSTVLAPLDGRALEVDGRLVRLEARGEEVWATLPDPDAVIAGRPASDVTRRVVMTTGSHREQAYWVAGERRGDLRLVPFVWLVNERAFVARRDAFLLPPQEPMPAVRWASSCIACHSVAGEPRHDVETDAFDTRVAELGVACEACHGPGAAHVERHRDPVARYVQHASKAPDPTIVHPGRLGAEASAAVCGQCHAYAFPRDEAAFWTDGYSRAFRAGERLEGSRFLITPATLGARGGPVVDAPVTAIFWADGAVRVGGREYNGLVASPCYERGQGERKMTCLSCHAMHAGEPAGQLAPAHAGDGGCASCHESTVRAGAAHTRHAAGSVGSACVACHMPRTSYALLSAVRSHRIDNPNVETSLATGRPNACNLCHLDRSLAWTARWLEDWYGIRSPVVPEKRARVAVGVRDGLAGDAGVRALIADALGSKEARAAAGSDWQAPLLAEMGRDPYAAVRFIAERSLRAVGAGGERRSRTPQERDVLGLDGEGRLDPARVRELVGERDLRPVMIAE